MQKPARPKTIGNLFLEVTQKFYSNDAIGEINNGQLHFNTFKEYKQDIKKISIALQKLGLRTEDKLAILGHTSKAWHYLDLATLCIRAVVVPIYPNYLTEDISYIFEHSESSFLAVEDEAQFAKISKNINNLPGLKAIISFVPLSDSIKKDLPSSIRLVSLSELTQIGSKILEGGEEDHFEKTIAGASQNDLATIIYTSGTTGRPKGAVLTQEALVNTLDNMRDFTHGAFSSNDCSLTFLPLSHVFGRVDSFLPLAFGSKMAFAESIEKVIDNLTLVRPTIMLAVPRIFEKLYAKVIGQVEQGSALKKKIFYWSLKVSKQYFDKIQEDRSPTPREHLSYRLAYKLVFSKLYAKFGGKVRFFISGGAPLAGELMEFLRCANLTILEGYGLTETCAASCINHPSKQYPGHVGIPIGDVQIKFDTDGEILLKTKSLFKEYFKSPDPTKAAFTDDGFFRTGDIGKLAQNGQLKITDRKKDLIITSGGKNIAPQKIENLMKLQKYISYFVVTGDRQKYLTAIVGIEKEAFQDVFAKFGLSTSNPIEEFASNPKVRELIEDNIELVNKTLPTFETIKHFYIAPSEFSVDTGELTPSLKIKRKVIIERYSDEISALYNS